MGLFSDDARGLLLTDINDLTSPPEATSDIPPGPAAGVPPAGTEPAPLDFGAQATAAGLGGWSQPLPPMPSTDSTGGYETPTPALSDQPLGTPGAMVNGLMPGRNDTLRRPGVSDFPDNLLGQISSLAIGPVLGAGEAVRGLMRDPGSMEASRELGMNLMGLIPGESGAMRGAQAIEAAVAKGVSRETATKIAVGNLKADLHRVQAAREMAGTTGDVIPGLGHLDDTEAALDRLAARPPAEASPGLARLDEIQQQIEAAKARTFNLGGPSEVGAEIMAAGRPGPEPSPLKFALPTTTEAAPFAAENTGRLGSLENVATKPIAQEITRPAPLGGAEIAAQNATLPKAVELPPRSTGPMAVEGPMAQGTARIGSQAVENAGPPLLAETRVGWIARYSPEPTAAAAASSVVTPATILPTKGLAAGEAPRGLVGPVTSSLGREFAGNIRLGKYQPQEVRDTIAQMYDANPSGFAAARGAMVTDAQVRDLATRVASTPKEIGAILKRWKPGTAENNVTITALRMALDAAATNVRAAQEVYAAASGADAPAALSRLVEELTKHAAIEAPVHGVTGEAGRALRIFRLDISPEQKVIAALKHMSPGTTMEDLALRLKNVNFDDPVAVAQASRDLYKNTWTDWVSWYFYNGLFSGPRGRILDTISSSMAALTAPIETAVAVPFDVARSALKGTSREVFAREVPAEYIGMQAALSQGVLDALRVMAHGPAVETARQDLQLAAREPIRGEVKGVIANLPTRLIAANDAFFNVINKSAAQEGLAVAQASKEGLKGQALVKRAAELAHSGVLEEEATRIGHYRVFQAPDKFSEWVSTGKNLPLVGPAIRLVIPVHFTAVNLAKMAAERSPLGFGMILGRTAGVGPAISNREISLGLARASIGSTLMGGTVSLARQGLVTGAAPREEAERDAFYRQGKQPYSVLWGGEWKSYQASPLAPVFGAAAAAGEALAEGRPEDALAIMTIVGLGFAKSMVDQPFMVGVANFLDALEDPKRFGMNYVENITKMVIPQALQTVARASDAIIRRPDGPIEAAMSVIPGLTMGAPAGVTAFGEMMTRPEGQQGLGAADPFRSSRSKSDPVETELARLQLKGLKVEPGFAGSTLAALSEDVKLTREQRDQYQRVSGKMAYGLIRLAVEGQGWAEIPDSVKAAEIQKYIDSARSAAAATIKADLVPQATTKSQAHWADLAQPGKTSGNWSTLANIGRQSGPAGSGSWSRLATIGVSP